MVQVYDDQIQADLPEAGAFYVRDRGYVDFRRLFVFTLCAAFFVGRTQKNVLRQRRYLHPVDRSTGLRSDHTVILTPLQLRPRVPGPPTAGELLRCRKQQAIEIPDQ